MKNKSIWSEYLKKDVYKELNEDIKTDVIIIGGGITGLNVLYQLMESGIKAVLVEKNTLGSGVTSKTTGKLTYLQENMCSKITTYHSLERAGEYVKSQMMAVKLAKEIITKENIDCNLEKTRSYIFCDSAKEALKKEQEILESIGIPLKTSNKLQGSNIERKNFYVEDTYVFNPIKYINEVARICESRGSKIYENTKIISIEEENGTYICKTPKNSITTKYIVLALHYPYFLSPFYLPLKSYMEKSYIEAFLTEKNYKYNAINIDKEKASTRFYTDNEKTYQLYLSNSHNIAIKSNDEDNFQELLNKKNTNPEYIWSNKDIMTIDAIPFIGRIKKNSNILLATGYNTWGMTNSFLAGNIITSIIKNKENKYIDLFSPTRTLDIKAFQNVPLIVGSSAYSFIKNKIVKDKKWYSENIKFEMRNGKNVAIYIDDGKKEHIVYPICPHLKCSLIFNEVEKTWDCPCHGSRFDIDGISIEGPSNYNISYKKE